MNLNKLVFHYWIVRLKTYTPKNEAEKKRKDTLLAYSKNKEVYREGLILNIKALIGFSTTKNLALKP